MPENMSLLLFSLFPLINFSMCIQVLKSSGKEGFARLEDIPFEV